VWYKFLYRKFDNNYPTIHIFFSSWYYPDYFKYIKRKNSDDKLVMYFGDTIKSKKKVVKNLAISKLKSEVNQIFSYNWDDVREYGLKYLPVSYSKINDFSIIPTKNKHDVIFIGASRDRYEEIVDLYKQIKNTNLKYFFYVVKSNNESDSFNDPNFILTNKTLNFFDYMGYVKSSKWIIELLDPGTVGTTLRFWDAIMYNKGLITNNKQVMQSQFYDSDNIIIYEKSNDIDLSKLLNGKHIDYSYNGENSPRKFLEVVKSSLFDLKEV
ncbi:TPA: hypothetical protein ACGO6M_002218, partial [Streptococcus suis]